MVDNNNNGSSNVRTYFRSESIVFRKTKEPFGGLSNMAGGFPIYLNGVFIRTSEALYQACRFPHLPEVQQTIIEQKSPMTAKMKSKSYRKQTRNDWDTVRIKIMKWCLRVKLAQNWEKFGTLLLETGNLPIVEESKRDPFWGAKPIDSTGNFVGVNALGRLLMELRDDYKVCLSTGEPFRVEPPNISNFLLFGQPIESVSIKPKEDNKSINEEKLTQLNLF